MINYNVEKILEDVESTLEPSCSNGKEKYGYCKSTKIEGEDVYIFSSDLIEYEYITIKNGEIVAATDKRCMQEFLFFIDYQYLDALHRIVLDFYLESPQTFKAILSKLKFGTLGYLYTLCYVQEIKKEELEEQYKNKTTAMDYYNKAVEEYKIDFEMKETFMKLFKTFYKKYKDNKKYENTIEYLNNCIESYENNLVKSEFNVECAISLVGLEIDKETCLAVDLGQIKDILNNNSKITKESLVKKIKQLQKTNQLKLRP